LSLAGVTSVAYVGAAHPVVLAASSKKNSSNPAVTIIFFALLLGLAYFVFLRPQRARAARAKTLQRELAPGEQVMTTAGLFGTVAAIEDDAILIEVAPGVTTRWAKAAVASVVPPAEALGLDDDDGSAEPHT
jgi:preprotein translocase subunit YajC